MNVEEIRDRIAELMGWDRAGTDKFSLPALRDFVRGKDPALDEELSRIISQGSHLFIPISGEWDG